MNQLLERRRGVQPAAADRAQASPAQARGGAAQTAGVVNVAPALSVGTTYALLALSRLAQRPARASVRLTSRVSSRLVAAVTTVAVIGGVPAPTIDYGTPAAATVGTAYNLTPALTGTGVTVAVSSGSLPAGLSIDASTGAITGTPTTAGESSFTVTATNAGGSASQTITITVAATLAGLATYKLDLTESGYAVYTTAAGTTQAADGDDAKAFVPQTKHADDSRWRADAWNTAAKFRDGAYAINGGPVIEITGDGTAFAKSGTGSGYMSTSKLWFVLSGKTVDSSAWDMWRAIFSWAGSAPPSNINVTDGIGVELRPGSSKLKIVMARHGQTPSLVESPEITYVRGSVFALGVYYDGTDVHIWLRDSAGLQTLTIEAPGDIIVSGALVEGMHFLAGNNTGTGYGWRKSAFLCGIDDGGDATGHKARIAAWIDARA